MGKYIKTSAVSTEIFTLTELKRYLVWTTSDTTRDDDMTQCIAYATEATEGIMGESLRAHEWAYYMESWVDEVDLLYGPFSAVVITYYDTDNALQTLSSSEYLVVGTFSQVILNGTMPNVYSSRPDAIKIAYTAVPELITDIDTYKTYIRLIAGELFENPVNDKDEIRKIALRIIGQVRSYI